MTTACPLFDTHAHLDDDQLSGILPDVLRRAQDAGIVGITAIGTTVSSSRRCVEIAHRQPQVWAAVGIHPNHAQSATTVDWRAIVDLASDPRVVAIGETGLDRYWDDCPWEVQVDYFRRHIDLSRATSRPLVIHMRDCEDELIAVLRSAAAGEPLRGIMHSFTGTQAGAETFLEFGLHLSFAGMITYRKSETLRQIAGQVPLDRLLLETDSPYLSPEPQRSKRPNEPCQIVHTARCVADARQMPFPELAQRTTMNAQTLFGLQ